VPAHHHLHLLTEGDALRLGPIAPTLPLCRRPGCAADAGAGLGFCSSCRDRYDLNAARRWRLTDVVCARLAASGNPLFAVFGNRARPFGAHVLAHLEESDARRVHVPEAAVRDYVDELDDVAWRRA